MVRGNLEELGVSSKELGVSYRNTSLLTIYYSLLNFLRFENLDRRYFECRSRHHGKAEQATDKKRTGRTERGNQQTDAKHTNIFSPPKLFTADIAET